jgi:hypothetical protein
MSIAFYDDALAPATTFRTSFDGNLGGSAEFQFYLRNDDITRYYTSVTVTLTDAALSSGWTAKLLSGSRRPTEREWDNVAVNATLALSDLGTTGAGDTSTYLPVWARIYCPGGTPAQERAEQTLTFSAYERMVGS